LRFFSRLVHTAQRYAPLPEDALANVGLSWPLLRRIFREVVQRLVAADVIAERDLVFWLKWDEAEAAARAQCGSVHPDYHPVVAERRARLERERAVTPPVICRPRGVCVSWALTLPA
jgi:pyruvate,water dikinase